MLTQTSAVLALATLACCGGWDPPSRATEPEGVAGRVVEASGAGAASATVWVVGGTYEEPEAVAETTTDDRGGFSFPGFWDAPERKGALKRMRQVYGLAARDSRGRLGWLTSMPRASSAPLKLVLAETGDVRGRLLDETGKAVAGAEIVPAMIVRSADRRSGADSLRLTPALARPLATTTAQDGRFTLRGIPRESQLQARIQARGFGSPRASWDTRKVVTIALEGHLGHVEGRLVTPDGKALAEPFPLSLGRRSPPPGREGGDYTLLYSRTIPVQGDGRFRFDDVPPGRYVLSLWADPATGYAAEQQRDISRRSTSRILCAQLKVENANPYDALGDSVATAECYRRLVTRHRLI